MVELERQKEIIDASYLIQELKAGIQSLRCARDLHLGNLKNVNRTSFLARFDLKQLKTLGILSSV
ncbi:MAG: hypothetical protein KBB71_08890 [Lentimicrobiaceae bacterium]|nr:hypothetical protein [Lentimicrobiaceae bacterium]